MFILTVLVFLVGETEPKLANKVFYDLEQCNQTAEVLFEQLEKSNATQFVFVACKPVEGDPA